LKAFAVEHELYVEGEKPAGPGRQALARERERIFAERAAKLDTLKRECSETLVSSDRQSDGYFLEGMFRELFSLFGLDYRKPTRPRPNRSTDTSRSRGLIASLAERSAGIPGN
jgi:hypothetical protein